MTAADAGLLDREIPEDYLVERTSHVAAERNPLARGSESVVVFRILNEWFALPTAVLQEVDEFHPAHALPHHRGGALNGLVNIRGELLLSISLAALLHLEQPAGAAHTANPVSRGRLLICSKQGSRFVFPVNEVQGVFRYHPKDLRTVPATLARAAAGVYVTGLLCLDGRTVGCLDSQLLFDALDKSLA